MTMLSSSALTFEFFTYEVVDNTSVTITGYTGPAGAVAIPETIDDAPVTSIADDAFKFYGGFTSVTIGDNVTSIGDSAFYKCGGLISITIGSGLNTVGINAFAGCNQLTGFTVDSANPNYTAVDGNLYSKTLTQLVAVPAGLVGAFTIPDGVTSIGDSAFWGCSSVDSITIPDSVMSIGAEAFSFCAMSAIIIPVNVSSIGPGAFTGCSQLGGFTVDSQNPSYATVDGVLYNKSLTELVAYPAGRAGGFTVPENVTSIGDAAFTWCSILTSVTISDSVSSIGARAFRFCSGLSTVVMPASATSIGDSAFESCNNITSLTMPAGVTTISDSLFYNCSKLTNITLPSGVTSIESLSFSRCSSLTSITIPSGVTSIADGAFSFCSNLTSITIPSTVTSIGGAAFSLCNRLRNITIPFGVTSIEDYTFFKCYSLTSISIPASVTSIGGHAFDRCSILTSITIPASVTSIGDAAFVFCSRLRSITIPASVTSIGSNTFNSCTSLASITVDSQNSVYASLDGVLFDKSLATLIKCPQPKAGEYTIPTSVTRIESRAFALCANLTSITLPSSVTSIGDYTFTGCSRLTSITIPSSVTSIGSNTFNSCTSLTSATFLGDVPTTVYDTVFINSASGFIVYYLSGADGFTSPIWMGYPSEMIDEVIYPAARWLLANGMTFDTNLHQDLNGDGVDLLLAYALDLVPENAVSGLPGPILEASSLSMNFYASALGVNYTVQTSEDMKSWSTEGVALSPIDSNGRRTATVDRSLTKRFMRLVVSD